MASWSVLRQSVERVVGPVHRGDVDGVERLEAPLALGPLLDGVDGPEEVGALGGLAAQDVADAGLADLAEELVEAVAAERLEQRGVDGLGAVVVLLGGDPRADTRRGPGSGRAGPGRPRRRRASAGGRAAGPSRSSSCEATRAASQVEPGIAGASGPPTGAASASCGDRDVDRGVGERRSGGAGPPGPPPRAGTARRFLPRSSPLTAGQPSRIEIETTAEPRPADVRARNIPEVADHRDQLRSGFDDR